MSLPTLLQKYVQHLPSCDALQQMWHKGPCDCGLAELLRDEPELKAMCGPQAAACLTCVDSGKPESGHWCGCEIGVQLKRCDDASQRYGGWRRLRFVTGKCCGCGASNVPTTPLGTNEAFVCEACYDRAQRDEERAERVATGGHVAPCADIDGDGYCDGCNREISVFQTDPYRGMTLPSCGVCLDGKSLCPIIDPPGRTQWTCLACGKLVGPSTKEA